MIEKPASKTAIFLAGIISISAFLCASFGAPKKNPSGTLSEVNLKAKIDTGKTAVAQVQAVFGKYSIETPASFQQNHQGLEHLKIEEDHQMGPCFGFYLHRDKDGDRNRVWPKGKERQRNEIKGYQGSPQTLKSSRGEVTRYHWFLKVNESFAVTKNFCHFFQLKAVGGEHASDPVATLSGAVYRGKPQLELRWWTKNGSQRMHIADWRDCRGRWLECECILLPESKGRLRFSIRSQDPSIRFARDLAGFPTWRTGFDFIRPKWGIYRSLANKGDIPNEQDSVRIANLSIAKLVSFPVQKSPIRQHFVNTGKPATGKNKESYSSVVPKPTLSEVRYGKHERNVLDFWKAKSSSPTPVAFVIHGGGWQGGSKERLDRFADPNALLKAGISVVAINYRYVTATETPPVKAPLHDAARALQFVRSKASEWNLDKNRIGAAGGSAGACSSLWLAFHDDLADPQSEDPVARESSRLSCAAVIGAQTTLDPQQMQEWTPNSRYGGHAFGLKSFADFLGQREKILPWIAEYSPYALVSRDDPPVYLIYKSPPAIGKAQKDPTHTSNFGVKLQERCKAQGVACELVYPGLSGVKYPTTTTFLISKLKKE